MLLFKDMRRDDDGMQLIEDSIPQLRAIYSILDEKARARIDERVQQSEPLQKTRIFTTEVLREAGRALRRRPMDHAGFGSA
jgi:hypothetical protein